MKNEIRCDAKCPCRIRNQHLSGRSTVRLGHVMHQFRVLFFFESVKFHRHFSTFCAHHPPSFFSSPRSHQRIPTPFTLGLYTREVNRVTRQKRNEDVIPSTTSRIGPQWRSRRHGWYCDKKSSHGIHLRRLRCHQRNSTKRTHSLQRMRSPCYVQEEDEEDGKWSPELWSTSKLFRLAIVCSAEARKLGLLTFDDTFRILPTVALRGSLSSKRMRMLQSFMSEGVSGRGMRTSLQLRIGWQPSILPTYSWFSVSSPSTNGSP